MSHWKDSFEQQQMLPRIRESLRLLRSAKTEKLGPLELVDYRRLLKVLTLLEKSLSNIDPDLFHPGIWSGNYPAWTGNLQNYVTAFAQDENPANLQHANNTVDEIINGLRPFNFTAFGENGAALIESSKDFQSQLIKEIEYLREKSGAVQSQLEGLSGEIAQAKERLTANDQTIEQQKGRLDQSIAEFQKQFSQAESTRQNESANTAKNAANDLLVLQQSFETKFSEAQEKRVKEDDDFLEAARKRDEEFLGFFERRQKEVNAIFGAIGSASLAGHYANEADKDRDAADLLRKVALGLMCSMILLAAYSFYQSIQNPTLDWKIFVFRLATVLVIAIPAVYAAQESAKHRERERHTRKLHLELASIDAYLVALPEGKRSELKEKLTEKFFGQPEINDKEENITNHALLELLSDVLKNLTKNK